MNQPEPNPKFLRDLNPEQLAAVTYPDESLLVLAGAGSGKTRVLTSRIMWLLTTGKSRVENILAVTFTNKAAKEMRSRLEKSLPYTLNHMWLGTFHGLCHRFLRQYHEAARLPSDFQIIDGGDQQSIIKRLIKQFPPNMGELVPKELLYYINSNKEEGRRSGDIDLTSASKKYREFNDYYARYEQICKQNALVDFAELLLRSVELLSANEALRLAMPSRFKYILVDEFQDTNNLQYRWLQLMAGSDAVLFAVGDDDQSIYSFRGANVQNMQKFCRDFHVAAPIKLERNYRSTTTILNAANEVIALNKNRIGKNLRGVGETGERIRFIQAYSEVEEALFVVDEAKSRHRAGERYQSMAVLYRSNAQSRAIEQALAQAGLPYKIYGGLRFFEREEIKHALAYLRLLVNPDDDEALLRVINFPNRGIGTKTLEHLQERARSEQVSLWTILTQEASRSAKLAAFASLIHELTALIDTLPFGDLTAELIKRTGLIAYYQQKKGDWQNKIDNLQELVNATLTFNLGNGNYLTFGDVNQESNNAISPREKIVLFLANAALEAGERESKGSNQKQDWLQLMTIHAAKGLEFDTVFLVGLEEGVFPSDYAIKSAAELEEERRLMYVAVTRAKKNLYLTATHERFLNGRRNISLLSRFVGEIPPELIHFLSGAPKIGQRYGDADVAFFTAKQGAGDAAANSDDASPYRLGLLVKHPKFGTGVVIKQQKKANSYLLTINFGQSGIKVLDSSFAKLTALT